MRQKNTINTISNSVSKQIHRGTHSKKATKKQKGSPKSTVEFFMDGVIHFHYVLIYFFLLIWRLNFELKLLHINIYLKKQTIVCKD